MAEVMIPPWIIPEYEQQDPLDEGSSVFRAAFAPGLAQRQSFGGLRLKLSRRHTVRAEEKAQLLAALNATRGSYNALRTKVHFVRRGSFDSSELLSNNTFASGTTGWEAGSVNIFLTAADRVLRSTRRSVVSAHTFRPTSPVTTVAYAPYVMRLMALAGRGAISHQIRLGTTTSGSEIASSSTFTVQGMQSLVGVAHGTSTFVTVIDGISGRLPGDYIDVPFISLSRCFLADNGVNSLLYSDQFDNAAWTKTRSSVVANDIVAPDGTVTADSIVEDATASNTHYLVQSSTVSASELDYAFTVALRVGARTWASLLLDNGTNLAQWFDLTNGVIGSGSTGANWSNRRSFIRSLGNSWYACTLVGRKTGSATTINARIQLATGDGSSVYNGDGTSNIYAWRATLAQSSVPTRLVQTTDTATAGSSQSGSALHVKGLPASTNGLLLPDDIVEINGEIKKCIAAINSDEAGLGYLQFEPALIRSPADNDPIIVTDPMGKFLVSNMKIDNDFGTQARVSYDLEHIYE